MFNLSQMTQILYMILVSVASLAGLLLIITIVERVLRRLARHHVTSTDLDHIGRKATVTQTIRPGRVGKVLCSDMIAEATADQVIRRGRDVLITAIDSGRFRVRPVAEKVEMPASATQQNKRDGE